MYHIPQIVKHRCAQTVGGAAVTVMLSGFAFAAEAAEHIDKSLQTAATSSLPALTVTSITPEGSNWPLKLSANGHIAAWQEARVGAELQNYRIAEVLVDVGATVRKDQVLAILVSATIRAELDQVQARLNEALAQLAEAKANGERARSLRATGALTRQQVNQMLTVEQTATARLQAARSELKMTELRLSYTRVLAPDDGVISARLATVGSNTQAGNELFRLIRGGRLEWQAEVAARDVTGIQPGMPAQVTTPDGGQVMGKVRVVAPTVDVDTGNALVYVDLDLGSRHARAGMFARGEFHLGQSKALTLPQAAVVLRDGFAYVYVLDDSGRVRETKVSVGRRLAERLEILDGIAATTRVVASGVGFLTDGDSVRVARE